jgi:hypothetical protein
MRIPADGGEAGGMADREGLDSAVECELMSLTL